MSNAPTAPAVQVEITMLGGFSIRMADKILRCDENRRKQLWTLLEFLIANRSTQISQERLVELLWDDDDCDNPANALKNLIYRLRKLLASLCDGGDGADEVEFIVCSRNIYSWNNSLCCRIDTEEMESAYREASRAGVPEDEKICLYSRAVELYKGEFLPQSSSQEWVIANAMYYKNIYIECVKGLARLLAARGEHREAAIVCTKAVSIEPFDESLHESIIEAYLQSGEIRSAIEHYEFVSDLFYEKLGIRLSDPLRAKMRDVVRTAEGIEKDLQIIEEDMSECAQARGAFLCDYEIFKNIYRIEARLAERFGQSVFVSLLTVEPGKTAGQEDIAQAMRLLASVITETLRKTDVVSRYSKTQYILMLPSLTFENGLMVISRVLRRFESLNRCRGIRVSSKLNPLNPVGSVPSRR